uniref:Transmembrane protein n=1 Tax=Lotharella vacuolata TaxID=74820 RepID=A0A0H5BK02_9EUKA|nr:hypothetical protein [Lotharella vacuolata]
MKLSKLSYLPLYMTQKYKIKRLIAFIINLILIYNYSICVINYYNIFDNKYITHTIFQNEILILKIFLLIKHTHLLKINLSKFIELENFLQYQKKSYLYLIICKIILNIITCFIHRNEYIN